METRAKRKHVLESNGPISYIHKNYTYNLPEARLRMVVRVMLLLLWMMMRAGVVGG